MSRALLLLLAACLLTSPPACRGAAQQKGETGSTLSDAKKDELEAGMLELRNLLYSDMSLDEALELFVQQDDPLRGAVDEPAGGLVADEGVDNINETRHPLYEVFLKTGLLFSELNKLNQGE